MKLKRTLMAAAFCGIVFTFCGCCSTRPNRHKRGEAENHERGLPVSEGCRSVLHRHGRGRSAAVRPFGTIHIFEGKLYIQTGRKKNVSRQLAANGKTELCAMKGDEWIRLSGTLVDDNRRRRRPRCSTPIPRSRRCTAQTTTIRRCSISRMLRRRSTPSHTSRW